ncbi:MAG TPA: (p)ppGpp synthetase [Lachnospiraceae bacterium]|nr:(p)ppGpp synthetase [Lachnospiraceae bacterium]
MINDEFEPDFSSDTDHISQEEYDELIKPYIEALTVIQLRLNSLNEEYRSRSIDYPIHNIQNRIKSRKSITKKLMKKTRKITIESAKDSLTDIAGIRVICYFEQDIYNVVSAIKKQGDLIVIKESDYVRCPKQNGYKSYHIVLGIPVFSLEETEYYPVEIQIRTLTMDLWASMEHRICYKNGHGIEVTKETKNMLLLYAQGLEKMEKDMQKQSIQA